MAREHDEDNNLDYEQHDKDDHRESHQQRSEKASDWSDTTEQNSTFGEAYGDDYGFGRHGEHEEPDAKDKETGSEYADRFTPPDYNEISGPPPHFSERLDSDWQPTDQGLQDEIWRLIFDNSGIDYSDVSVLVDNREVFLEGTVDSEEARQTLTDIGISVDGVEQVHNDLQIRSDAA